MFPPENDLPQVPPSHFLSLRWGPINRLVTAFGKFNSTMLDAIKAKWAFHHKIAAFPVYRLTRLGMFFRQDAD